ncbi:hypothetical protein Scep_021443 [Stephania cephalantha]|uniref:Uncharacterized protein n=1 Tax=Stephania cephalantha TaxID=152367 RepID=A0AAP0F4C5_9MAGN
MRFERGMIGTGVRKGDSLALGAPLVQKKQGNFTKRGKAKQEYIKKMAHMDCTIGLEDGVRRVLKEEIEEIFDSDEEFSEEDMIDLNLNAIVLDEGMIFGTLDEAKLAWLRYDIPYERQMHYIYFDGIFDVILSRCAHVDVLSSSSIQKKNLALQTIKKLEQVMTEDNDQGDVQVVVSNVGAKNKINTKSQKMKDPLRVMTNVQPQCRFKSAYEKQVEKINKGKAMAVAEAGREGENGDGSKS